MDTRITDEATRNREEIDRALRGINTCIPGVIESFDSATQTATVIPAIKMRTFVDEHGGYLNMPPIIRAPVVFPVGSASGFALTFPVSKGDPCLILFSQRGIDNWHEKGGIQPPEAGVSNRHHDLTDAIVLMAPLPLSNSLGSFQSDGIEMRNRDRSTFVKVRQNSVTIGNQSVVCTLGEDGSFVFGGDVISGGISLQTHTHPDPQGGNTGPPNQETS